MSKSFPVGPAPQQCPVCGSVSPAALAEDGVCLRCAGQRVFGLMSAEFNGEGPSFDPAMPADSMDAVASDAMPSRIGPYEILEEIGRGGMGRVFAARHQGLGRIVALKVIAENPSTAALELRFLREVQTMAQLRHPGIVAVHDSGRANGYVYFSMDHIAGGDLAKRLRRGSPTFPESADLVRKISAALDCAHRTGVLHRDIKPSNILLDGDVPQLADFGLAAQLEAGGDLTAHTGVLGTPHYLAPEALLHGSAALGVASDVYALGVVLFELLTGRTPFAGASPAELPALFAQGDLPSPRLSNPAVPRDLETICLTCLAPEPARRYASAAALAEDLRLYLAGEPIKAQPPSPLYLFQKFARRHRAAVTAAVAISVVLIAATTVSAWLAVRATKAEKRASSEAASARAISDFLVNDLLRNASPRLEADRDIKLRTVLDRAEKKINGRFADQPLVEVTLRDALGSTYYTLGEYALVKAQLERALEVNQRLAGPDDPRSLDLAASLAMTNSQLGDYVTAERQLRELRERHIRVLGPNHPGTLITAVYLANLLHRSSKTVEAVDLLRETLAARIKVLGPDHPTTIETESLMTDMLSSLGKFEESQARQTTVLEKQRRILGPEHPATIRTLVSMALTCNQAGQLGDSIRYSREALVLAERVQGPDAPNTLTLKGNLAASLRANGDFAESEAIFGQILPVLRKTRGPDHQATLGPTAALAALYRAQQKFPESEALLRECLAAMRRSPASGQKLTASILLELAGVCQDQGRLSEAEQFARESLALCQTVIGAEHPTTAGAMHQLAMIYYDQARYDEALALLQETTALRQKILGPQHTSTRSSLLATSNTLARMGRFEEANALAQEAFDSALRQLGREHLDTLAACDRLAQTFIAQGKFAEAEALLRPNLELRRKTSKETWRAFDTENLLGAALAGLGRQEEAEPLLVESATALSQAAAQAQVPRASRQLVTDSAARTAHLFKTLGKTDLAAAWQAKAAPALNKK